MSGKHRSMTEVVMCIFTQDVGLVSDTSIFARGSKKTQYLVYQMRYAAPRRLAMVLPLPVPPQPRDDAVRFINLDSYPSFFEDMQLGFPGNSTFVGTDDLLAAAPLTVHDVGMYEASFAPAVADFSRLDRRFRISKDVWAKLPTYGDYGFAIFKLKRTSRPRAVHPMALQFPRRNRDLLYFPTLHIHDGDIHPEAEFDHVLYCQPDQEMEEHTADWHRSSFRTDEFMSVDASQGVVARDVNIWRLSLSGIRTNTDVLIGRGGVVPRAV